jgi:hypothetical protein
MYIQLRHQILVFLFLAAFVADAVNIDLLFPSSKMEREEYAGQSGAENLQSADAVQLQLNGGLPARRAVSSLPLRASHHPVVAVDEDSPSLAAAVSCTEELTRIFHSDDAMRIPDHHIIARDPVSLRKLVL